MRKIVRPMYVNMNPKLRRMTPTEQERRVSKINSMTAKTPKYTARNVCASMTRKGKGEWSTPLRRAEASNAPSFAARAHLRDVQCWAWANAPNKAQYTRSCQKARVANIEHTQHRRYGTNRHAAIERGGSRWWGLADAGGGSGLARASKPTSGRARGAQHRELTRARMTSAGRINILARGQSALVSTTGSCTRPPRRLPLRLPFRKNAQPSLSCCCCSGDLGHVKSLLKTIFALRDVYSVRAAHLCTSQLLFTMRAILFAAMLTAMASAQQPEMAHLSVTGKQNELALDFVGHTNCSVAWGVQYGTSPDLSAADFHPVYACTDYTASEPGPTFMLRALLTGLVSGTKYYYAACIENSREPCSQIFSFTYDSGANRPGGRAYAVLADFGYYNAER